MPETDRRRGQGVLAVQGADRITSRRAARRACADHVPRAAAQRLHDLYLDAVEPIEEPQEASRADDADEVAWKTTVEAAPYPLGADAGERELSPRDLFQELQPFKELVAEDIERSRDR
jgi:hypothetical protein